MGASGEDAYFNTGLLIKGNMPDNAISSVRVPFGVVMTLYTANDFNTGELVVDGSIEAGGVFGS